MQYRLKDNNDEYKGFKVTRVNQYGGAPTIQIVVKYSIKFKGSIIYFKTQNDLIKFIDEITK